jgi:hypothetical protein
MAEDNLARRTVGVTPIGELVRAVHQSRMRGLMPLIAPVTGAAGPVGSPTLARDRPRSRGEP